MEEKKMRRLIIATLKRVFAFPVENGVQAGCPDICTPLGWIELKIASWPKGKASIVRINLRNSQRIWLRRWTIRGGEAWVLTLIEGTWLMHDGAWSAKLLGKVGKDELLENAEAVWHVAPGCAELIAAMRRE